MIKRYLFICWLLILQATAFAQVKVVFNLYSPNKETHVEAGTNAWQRPVYRVLFKGKEILSWSALGLFAHADSLNGNLKLTSTAARQHREVFAWPLGENDTIRNDYNESALSCVWANRSFVVQFRLFDGSVAFRYQLPAAGKSPLAVNEEQTAFNLSRNFLLYQYNQESVFTPVRVDTFNTTSDLPSTLSNDQFFISIGEAANDNYTKAELKRGIQPHSLRLVYKRDSLVRLPLPCVTPWRTISIAGTATGLQYCSQLFLKLAEPSPQVVPSWIKPGKLIRSQLSTQSALDCIDFAAAHRFQYIMFDAGWYGAEFRTTSDPTQPIPEIDLRKIIQYGKEKNIGLILYVNYVGLKAKLDTLIPLYKSWGVSGLKFGFVDGLTQNGIQWLAGAIKKVNDAGFILDIHDNYKPTGLSRSFPALLTQEGIRGDENSPDAFHTTVLPFTRFLAGPADFTLCYPNSSNSYSKNIKVSKAQQLALTVVYFSPLQSIFWYGLPKQYTNEAEIEFFANVPTVWNETRYLRGGIGKYVCVARRSGTDWYMGSAAGLEDWNDHLSLRFLTPGKKYAATIYEDDGQGSIRKRTLPVNAATTFTLSIKARGGQAIIIRMNK